MQAMMLMKSGQSTAALELVIKARDKAKEEFGRESKEYAEALYDHGSISLLFDQYEYAVESLRIATEISPTTDEMKKNRLNYLLNLGEVLAKMGEYSEAEDVLRMNLRERAEYYGLERGAYAFALDSLARVLIKVKKYSEAETLATQAINIFKNEGNPQFYSTLAFRGLCTKAVHGINKPAFSEFDELNSEQTTTVYDHCIQLAEEHEPHYSTLLLYDLRDSLLKSGHANDLQIFMIGMEIDFLSRKLRENKIRIQELEWTLERPEVQKRKEFLAELYLALGVAYSDIGDIKAAEKAFKTAESRASDANNNSIQARVLRNYAMMELKRQKYKDAKKLLEQGLKLASKTSDTLVIGRLQILLGIVLKELGKEIDAKIALNEGILKIPRNHPDALLAHAQLAAAKIGLKKLPLESEEQILSLAVRNFVGRDRIVTSGGRADILNIEPNQIDIYVNLDGLEPPDIKVTVMGIPNNYKSNVDDRVKFAISEVTKMHIAKGQFIPL